MMTYLTLTGQIQGIALLPVLAIAAGITQIPAVMQARKAKTLAKEVNNQ